MRGQRTSTGSEATAAFFRHLVAGIVLLNVFVVGLTVLALTKSRAQYEELAAATTQNLALAIEQYLAAMIDRIDADLLDVAEEAARQIAAGGIDGPALHARIARHRERQPAIDGLRVSDAKGRVLHGECAAGTTPPAVAERGYFIRLRDDSHAGLVFSDAVEERGSRSWMIVLARRIDLADGSFGGAVCAGIPLERFKQFFAAIDLGRNGIVSLRDHGLRLIVRYPERGNGNSIGNTEVSPELRGLVASGRATGTYFTTHASDGIARKVTFRQVAGYPFYIIVGLAGEQYLAKWWGEVVQLSVLAVFFALISGGLSWIFYHVWMDRIAAAARAAQMHALAMELTMAEERERYAIAQDLHDDLGQTLAIAKLKLTALALPATHDPLMAEIKAVEAMIDKANRSVRSLSLQLSPPILHQFGLVPALQWLAEEMQCTYGLNVRVHDDGQPKPLGESASNTLFRAVRELLINVAKHAKVTAADVTTATESGRLVIAVADAGCGFDPSAGVRPSSAGGYGLFSVRERMSFIGGEVQIDSRPGDGTVVVLSISLAAAPGGK